MMLSTGSVRSRISRSSFVKGLTGLDRFDEGLAEEEDGFRELIGRLDLVVLEELEVGWREFEGGGSDGGGSVEGGLGGGGGFICCSSVGTAFEG